MSVDRATFERHLAVANFDFFVTFLSFVGDEIFNFYLPFQVVASRCKSTFWIDILDKIPLQILTFFSLFLYRVDFSRNAETSVAAEPFESPPGSFSLQKLLNFL